VVLRSSVNFISGLYLKWEILVFYILLLFHLFSYTNPVSKLHQFYEAFSFGLHIWMACLNVCYAETLEILDKLIQAKS